MKRAVIVMMLLVGAFAFAQKGERGERERMKDLSPDQIATIKSKKATLALDLTTTQQTQMKALFVANAKMRKSKMEARKAQKESGETKVISSEERYTIVNERLDHQIAQKEKLNQILSDEQFAKWEKMQHRRGKHKKGKGNRGNKNREHKKKSKK